MGKEERGEGGRERRGGEKREGEKDGEKA